MIIKDNKGQAYKGFIFVKTDININKINWKLSNPQKAILLNIFKLHNIKNLDELLYFCLTEQINKPFKHYGNNSKYFGKKQKKEIKNCLIKFYPDQTDRLISVFTSISERQNLINY